MQTKVKEVKLFVASDGREFENESSCVEYEECIPLKKYYVKLRDIMFFEVKEAHKIAIKRMNFWWDIRKNSIPECMLDPKRPFGNSDIYGDLAEILQIPKPDYEKDEEFTPNQLFEMRKFFLELWVVLNILTSTCELKVGHYKRVDNYADGWKFNG